MQPNSNTGLIATFRQPHIQIDELLDNSGIRSDVIAQAHRGEFARTGNCHRQHQLIRQVIAYR
jgi:hypothetical protein